MVIVFDWLTNPIQDLKTKPDVTIFVPDEITWMLIIRVHSKSLTVVENITLNFQKGSMLSTNFATSGAFSVTRISSPHSMFMSDNAVTNSIIGHSKPKKTTLFRSRFILPIISMKCTFMNILIKVYCQVVYCQVVVAHVTRGATHVTKQSELTWANDDIFDKGIVHFISIFCIKSNWNRIPKSIFSDFTF